MQNISYEEIKRLKSVLESIPIKESGGIIFSSFISDVLEMVNITDDEDFNKAVFETLKKADPSDRYSIYSDISGKLGYNKKGLVLEGTMEEEIEKRIEFEKEKYKDFENKDEIIAEITKELRNWKIYDYGKFIDGSLIDLKRDISNPMLPYSAKYYLLKKLAFYEDLQNNYNKIKNEPKYA